MRSRLHALALAATLLAAPGFALADDAAPARPAPTGGVLSLLPLPSVTQHSMQMGDRTLRYEARAGTLALRGGDGAVTAEIFHVAYDLKPESGAATGERPVTFVFNGGPGAASVYLHLGALGPRVIETGADGGFLPPPQKLADNPDTWLDFTDLVFVDPVGTGYSRAAPGAKPEDFWGVEGDASALGAFVRLYLQANGRTRSPVFLAGESYGGFRAALLARTLTEEAGIGVSGLVLISPALEFSIVRADDLNPLKWAFALPSMAAVRLAREGVSGEALEAALAEVERYALSDYLVALARGRDEGGAAAAARVAAITGLAPDLVRRYAARVPAEVFAKEAGRAGNKVLSLYDGTLSGPDVAPESGRAQDPDPVLDRSVPVLGSAFADYVRRELGYRTEVTYRVLNGEVAGRWNYGTGPSRQGFAGVLDDLQRARALNPALGVLVAHGASDLVTPYLATRYLLGQLPILSGARPIREKVYEGGHMMYLLPRSRAALKRDAAALYAVEAGG